MSKFVALTFLLLVMVVVSDSKRCYGYRWRKYRNTCYFFSDSRATWFDAQTMCRLLGGKLAEFRHSGQERFLIRASLHYGREFWIGGNDLLHEGHWRWITSGKYIPPRIVWASRQPDNWRGREDCMHYWFRRGWNDLNCYNHRYFICEK